MQLFKTEEYNEDFGPCLFINFSRDENGNVLGEPPEVCFSSGYLQEGFEESEWPYFIKGDLFNHLFEQADPKSFPPKKITKEDAFDALENAVSQLHAYACSLPIGKDREKAFAIFQAARIAPRAEW
jgi:hypothetical protein